MTPEIYAQLVDTLKREPLPLQTLHAYAVDAGSSWSVHQLHLMLAVMDGVSVDVVDSDNPMVRLGERSQAEQLADAIAEVVRSQGGRPLPAAQVLTLLPGRFATSVEQIKKVARQASGLRVVGPGLIDIGH
ncbi:MAG: hypothetical protein OEU26_17815 [Candidatus Tectomicrobia bacterium]|nr:hypothetical protein [Candidatus Tectomicrobia bacterium]